MPRSFSLYMIVVTMKLLVNGLLCLIYDVLRCPVQFVLGFVFRVIPAKGIEVPETAGVSCNESIGIVVHHFAPYGRAFVKTLGGREYSVGINNLLPQVNMSGVRAICYVAGAQDKSYIEILKNEYSNIKFEQVSGERYDFESYFKGAGYFQTQGVKFLAFFNDNVEEGSNFLEFIRYSLAVLSNNKKCALLGIGTNTYLTQSLFKKSFSPHIQTYAWVTRAECFMEFAVKRLKWLETSWDKPMLKQLICRLFEQGYSRWLLYRGYLFVVKNGNSSFGYRRTLKWFDFISHWNGYLGDSRHLKAHPFQL